MRCLSWMAIGALAVVVVIGFIGCRKPPNPNLTTQMVANIVAWAPENQTYEGIVKVLGPPTRVEEKEGDDFRALWFNGVDVMKLTLHFEDGFLSDYDVQETPAKGLERRRELLDEL
jgi:hypothetical protein